MQNQLPAWLQPITEIARFRGPLRLLLAALLLRHLVICGIFLYRHGSYADTMLLLWLENPHFTPWGWVRVITWLAWVVVLWQLRRRYRHPDLRSAFLLALISWVDVSVLLTALALSSLPTQSEPRPAA